MEPARNGGEACGVRPKAVMLTSERCGTWVYYRVEPSVLAGVAAVRRPHALLHLVRVRANTKAMTATAAATAAYP
jgi:hypothetical protein